MKQVFGAVFACLIVLSGIALAIQPRSTRGDGRVHLTWVTSDNPAREEQIRLFEKLNPGIAVSIDPANSGTDKIIVQSQANVGPDMFDCYDPSQLDAFARSGIAWNVTDAMRASGIDVRASTWSVSSATCMVGDQVYGFPTAGLTDAVWINKDAFARAGLALPKSPVWTWEQFIPVAKRLTLRDPQSGRVTQWGVLLDLSAWQQFVEQYGGTVYSPDKTRCMLDSPDAVRGLQLMHDIIFKYQIAPSPAEVNAMATTGGFSAGGIAELTAGRGAMLVGGRYCLISLRQDPSLHLTVAECPYPAGGYQAVCGYAHSTMINAKSPNREAALKFLQYLAGEPYCRLINRDADGIAAVKRYTNDSPENVLPNAPDDASAEDITVWRDSMPYGDQIQISPFIDPDAATLIIQKQLDLILADQKPVAQAMADAAGQINAVIAQNVSRDPDLRKQYNELHQSTPAAGEKPRISLEGKSV